MIDDSNPLIKRSRLSGDRDVLSDLLSSLQVSGSAFVLFEFSSPWTVNLLYPMPHSYTVVEGGVWLVENDNPPRYLGAGDSFILPRGTSNTTYFISSAKDIPKPWTTPEEVFEGATLSAFDPDKGSLGLQQVQWGGEGDDTTRILSFAFSWRDKYHGPLIDALPELMHIVSTTDTDILLQYLLKETVVPSVEERAGSGAMATAAAQFFLLHLVRTFAIEHGRDQSGWLRGFTHPQLARVLTGIHDDPGRKWTLAELAKLAAMSRTAFSRVFNEVMGETPFDYLRSWRMHLARLALVAGNKSVTTLSMDLGYQSEAAFRTAFRKETGQSPREYVKSLKVSPSPVGMA